SSRFFRFASALACFDRCGTSSGCCGFRWLCCRFRATSTLRRWRRRWWRRWRRERFEEFRDLGMRPHFTVEHAEEYLVVQARPLRMLRRDTQLGHLRHRQLIFYLSPLAEEILDLLLNRLLTRRQIEEQYLFRFRLAQQFPSARRSRRFLAGKSLR